MLTIYIHAKCTFCMQKELFNSITGVTGGAGVAEGTSGSVGMATATLSKFISGLII